MEQIFLLLLNQIIFVRPQEKAVKARLFSRAASYWLTGPADPQLRPDWPLTGRAAAGQPH